MIEEMQRMMDEYLSWLKDRTILREVEHWVEITTPFLDRHNDYLQIYARREGDKFVLTDAGYTIDDLELSGCALDSEKRVKLLQVTVNGFGVALNEGALEVRASANDFALRKHNLVQAMLAVNDLFYLAKPIVTSLFLEDVMSWLDEHGVRYVDRVKFSGRSGYDHLFDFVIPRSQQQPERILRAINRPERQAAQSLVFAWVDTRETRSTRSRAFAVLNDQDQRVPGSVSEALGKYAIEPVLWSCRETVVEQLAA